MPDTKNEVNEFESFLSLFFVFIVARKACRQNEIARGSRQVTIRKHTNKSFELNVFRAPKYRPQRLVQTQITHSTVLPFWLFRKPRIHNRIPTWCHRICVFTWYQTLASATIIKCFAYVSISKIDFADWLALCLCSSAARKQLKIVFVLIKQTANKTICFYSGSFVWFAARFRVWASHHGER